MRRTIFLGLIGPVLLSLIAALGTVPAAAGVLSARAPDLPEGTSWTVLVLPAEAWPEWPDRWEGRIFWDLRPGRGDWPALRWTVRSPEEAHLAETAARVGADRALCADDPSEERRHGCRLFLSTETGPAGPRILWSELPEDLIAIPRDARKLGPDRLLAIGSTFRETMAATGGSTATRYGQVLAEGVVLVPAGPREALLLREEIRGADGARLRYRFVTRSGLTAALLEGSLPDAGKPFRPTRGEVLLSATTAADDGIEVAYRDLSHSMAPGIVGVAQYSVVTNTPLTSLHEDWTSVAEMITVDQASADYQPDPGDPSSLMELGEVWDLTGLQAGNMTHRSFISTRSELSGPACPETCAVRDLGENPPDGTWQEYLKIDVYDTAGAIHTRDSFMLNDNDGDSSTPNPAIDLPFVSQDEMNTNDWSQICAEDSANGAGPLIHFFQFFGADPDQATLKRGDTWTSGAWTECDAANGLWLTLASQCGTLCYPDCDGVSPFARGMLGGGAGIQSNIIEDGWVRVPAGNYVPALLMEQITDLEAGLDFLVFICSLGATRNRSIDYFWIHPRYGYLATVSSPTDDTGTLPPGRLDPDE